MFLAKLLSPQILSQQLRKPSGLIGRFLISKILEKGNNDLNLFVLETLELELTHHVLELGFGPGELINSMALIATEGHIEGIDFSGEMLSKAFKNNKKHIVANRVILQKGNCESMSFSDNTFDRVCAVNTLYFWKHLNHI